MKNKRLLTDKECGDVGHKEGEHLQWCQPILEAQDAKTLRKVGKFLEQFTEGDIYGDERTGDYMLFQMPPKVFKALKQGKLNEK